MNVGTVAAELATKLATITNPELRVYPFPPDAVAAPCAIVGHPQSGQFDVSAGRGVDRLLVPVYVLVPRTWDRSSADQLAVFTSGSGATSIKQVLQTRPHTAFSTLRVQTFATNVISVEGIEYWAVTFLCDITGPGA